MVVNFEFLGMESVENVITCMHYKVDKVEYFGYPEMVNAKKARTEKFLRKRCRVKEVVFHSLPRGGLQEMLSIMRQAIEEEKKKIIERMHKESEHKRTGISVYTYK